MAKTIVVDHIQRKAAINNQIIPLMLVPQSPAEDAEPCTTHCDAIADVDMCFEKTYEVTVARVAQPMCTRSNSKSSRVVTAPAARKSLSFKYINGDSEKPSNALFHHYHPVLNSRSFCFFFKQLQRFIHGFVR